MNARLRKLIADLAELFWLLPAAMVLAAVLLAVGLVQFDRAGITPKWLTDYPWFYTGGGTGARTLLGMVAASAIGVAGTVFSITIAALSLAAGQMGPRLLRNFTRDRGNQATLGIFLGTFAYSITVLSSIRTTEEGAFVPDTALTVAILLAFLCVAMLVFFVGHMAGRINVDTVISLVSADLEATIKRLSSNEPPQASPPVAFWEGAATITDARRGYLQELDTVGLADWAAAHGTAIRLLVGAGDHVFPGAPIALVQPEVEGAAEAVRAATALGGQRVSSADLEFAVRHLVEVAVRALSPGINDPHTAISVLDRLGAALCTLAGLNLLSSVELRHGQPALVVPGTNYGGLTDAMFHMIRQNATTSPSVLIRLLDVLTFVLSCEDNPGRITALQRHADLVLGDARRSAMAPEDLADLAGRHRRFVAVRAQGACGFLHGQAG